jgi:hypothetical protein
MPDFSRLLRECNQTEYEAHGVAHFPAIGMDVDVSVEACDDELGLEPVFEMLAAILRHPHSIRGTIAAALFDYYHTIRPYWTTDYGGDEEAERLAPRITAPDQVWPLLRDRHIADRTPSLSVSDYKNDLQALGFLLDFPCTWDCEHGVALRVRRWAVVKVGIYGTI